MRVSGGARARETALGDAGWGRPERARTEPLASPSVVHVFGRGLGATRARPPGVLGARKSNAAAPRQPSDERNPLIFLEVDT
jgi:hypothetical protein